jgi:3-oxoacyl-[acyl-carrier protein] reductase
MPPTDSTNRVAIVTGASRGIGAEVARALAAHGRHVVLVARNAERLEQLRSDIESGGGRATIRACDICDQAALEKVIEDTAAEHKRLDMLINNAGITRDNLVLRMTDEEFDEVVTTNLRCAFVACRTALRPMMRGKWGRIVNIGSVAGLVGNAGQANYAAAKAGLAGFTKSIAREMASKNITANVVAPGFIETDMTSSLPEQIKEMAVQAIAMRRMGQPGEVAAAVAYLTSEDAGYVTGQVLTVDGGMTMC